MELNKYRDDLEQIDQKIMDLIKARLALSVKIGQYKVEHNLPVLDSVREQELLLKYQNKYNDNSTWNYYNEIFGAILKTSKAIQNE